MDVDAAALFERHAANPILTAASCRITPTPCSTPAPPGWAPTPSCWCGSRTSAASRTCVVARSADGVTGWRFDDEPLLAPQPEDNPEEVWGCEDPRLTWLPEREEWAIAYTAYSRRGPLVSLAMTRDFSEVRRLGPAMPPEDKDAALFPRRFDGRWAMIHRPTPLRGGAHMWISYSPDLRHWGDHSLAARGARRGLVGRWQDRAGAAAARDARGLAALLPRRPPDRPSGPIYRIGLALLDLDDPCVVLRRTDDWVFGPMAPYERSGDVNKVVFPTGWVHDPETDLLSMYYGAGDTCHRPGDGEATGRPGLPDARRRARSNAGRPTTSAAGRTEAKGLSRPP